CDEPDACSEQIGHRALPSQGRQESYHELNDAHGNAPVLRTNSRHIACSHAGPLAKGAPMTFGKCVWDGCTRHAEKPATNACRSHHATIRDNRCEKCQGALTSVREVDTRHCRRCVASRAA